MNHSNFRLPLVTFTLGIAACILRFCLYHFGTDEKGLLISGHPLAIALWVLTAAAAVFVLWQVWKHSGKYCSTGAAFPKEYAMAGCIVFAAGLAATVLENRQTYTAMELVRNITGLLAVPSLVVLAFCRMTHRQPFFGFHGILCLALTLHTISYYRSWSSQPQLVSAFFPMMACLMLMLFAYYRTAADVGLAKPGMQLGTGLLAVFFCLAAIPESTTTLLYLTGSIWVLTNLSTPEYRHNNEEECQ